MRTRQKRVATDTWRSLGCRTPPLEHWSRRKPTVESQWAKQQTKKLWPKPTKINSFMSGPSLSLPSDVLNATAKRKVMQVFFKGASMQRAFNTNGKNIITTHISSVFLTLLHYYLYLHLFEWQHNKINKMTYSPSEDFDQPGHLPSMISLPCPLF